MGLARERLSSQSEVLWDAYPEGWMDPVLWLTDLGGPEGAILVLALVYWLVDRDRAATVAVYVIVGGAAMLALKFALELGRPGDLLDGVEPVVDDDDPYGFPSGHALNAVVLYGGLVYTFDKLDDWRYVLGAAALIVAISMTRIFLRVHFLGDLIVGALLGVAVILVLDRVVTDLRVGFALGVVAAGLAVLASGFHEYTLAIFGIAIGALFASFLFHIVPPLASRVEGGLLVVIGLAYLVVVMAISDALVADPSGFIENAFVVGAHAVLVVGVFLIPVVVSPLDCHRKRLMRG